MMLPPGNLPTERRRTYQRKDLVTAMLRLSDVTPQRRMGPRRILLASVALWLAPLPDPAWSQSCTVSGGACTIGGGPYSAPFSYNAGSSALNATNNAEFYITTSSNAGFLGMLEITARGAGGTNRSDSDAGSGGTGGTLTVTNNGASGQSIFNLLNTPTSAVTLYAASAGGKGGDYTDLNDKHDAGAAGRGGNVTLTNAAGAAIFMTGINQGVAPSNLVFGALLLADSLGGMGGRIAANSTDSDGNPNYQHDGNASAGGAAGTASITSNGTVTADLTGGPTVAHGYVGVGARSIGGDAGQGPNGPSGGGANQATATATGPVSVRVGFGPASNTAISLPATIGAFSVLALSQGGLGTMSVDSSRDGGGGGNASAATVTAGLAGTPVTISLTTTNPAGLATLPTAAVLAAISRGGDGGAGYHQTTGGQGGASGIANVTTLDGVTLQANGGSTLGVLALSQGGDGGGSGLNQSNSAAGNGGGAGTPGSSTAYATISMTNTVVTSSGLLSPGVQAAAMGGRGGTGLKYGEGAAASANPDGFGGRGAGGGNTGGAAISMTGGSVTTTGAQSPGLIAMARGGDGGMGGELDAFGGHSGDGGSGGQGGAVSVTLNSGATISTSGAPAADNSNPAHGILASSIGGRGGDGGALNSEVGGAAGAGMFAGSASNVTVTINSGIVTTQGTAASAIAALSLGGDGGSANQTNAAGLIGVAATGGNSGSSGTVTVTNAGTLTTLGALAHGILAVSRSGVSGNGSNGTGGIYGPAGDAGVTGTTGAVSVSNTGVISTSGTSAFGIQAQSVGGGSGTGGSASGSVLSFGGSATAAAVGGSVTVNQNAGSITTRGDYALGILAQTLGGGGGNAGSASGVFTSIGGTGGGGGAGGAGFLNINGGGITSSGRLAHGAVVQSIGGGGGIGGDATSASTLLTLSIGGSGGAGGGGGTVNATATGGSIGTNGSNAAGLVVQSIAGGGGAGGSAYSLTGGVAFSAAMAIGGTAGSGGNTGTVTLNLSSLTVATGGAVRGGTNQNPVDSYGILGQSVGGGGGLGGSSAARALAVALPVAANTGSSVGGSVTAALGGTGGAGGAAGTVALTLRNSGITTQGQGAHAILLQAVGGGGGAGGDSSAMATTTAFGRGATQADTNVFTTQITMTLGGNAGSGGKGGFIQANLDSSTILTAGDYAHGFLAQSLGGGGGNAGIGSSTTQAFGSTRNITATVNLGARGGNGGDGAALDGISLGGGAQVQTYGASALGALVQSIGGGGGTSQGGTLNLGATYTLGSGVTVTPTGSLTVNLGTAGGSGGKGGDITNLLMAGRIRTAGSDSAGMVVQSIGGGGGIGGSAGAEASSDSPVSLLTGLRSTISAVVNKDIPRDFSYTLNIGGAAGSGGNGGAVGYAQTGGITTQGDWSHGVLLQSIGGGGGMGGAATSLSSPIGAISTVNLGGRAGAGGAITLGLNPGGSISTGLVNGTSVTGLGAFGVLAQSIGGGGGTGVDGSTNSGITMRLGGTSSGASGNGGAITVNGGNFSITTRGDVGVGMALQSIGAGGGVAAAGNHLSAAAGVMDAPITIRVGSTGNAAGNGSSVRMNNIVLNITTSGAHAYGILAQSIGGGGGFGFAANLSSSTTNAVGTGMVSGTPVATDGGAVQLTSSGDIRTSGVGAHGIVAQSIGGGGGIAGLPTGTPSLNTLGYIPSLLRRGLRLGQRQCGDDRDDRLGRHHRRLRLWHPGAKRRRRRWAFRAGQPDDRGRHRQRRRARGAHRLRRPGLGARGLAALGHWRQFRGCLCAVGGRQRLGGRLRAGRFLRAGRLRLGRRRLGGQHQHRQQRPGLAPRLDLDRARALRPRHPHDGGKCNQPGHGHRLLRAAEWQLHQPGHAQCRRLA
jgi:hypothetical protein